MTEKKKERKGKNEQTKNKELENEEKTRLVEERKGS